MISCTIFRARFLAWVALCAIAASAHATDYTEGTDLSNTFTAPTSMGPLTLGNNVLTGNVGISSDLDYVTFSVPAGNVLNQITLNSYASSNGTAFMGMQAGTAFTKSATAAAASDLLGYVHFGTGPGNVGTNVLDDIGTAAGSPGFTPPLGPGSYSLWIQNTTPVSTAYQFNLIVAVPEPQCLTLVSLGVCGVSTLFRRRPRMTFRR